MVLYAHSLPAPADKARWEPLREHLECVAQRGALFAQPFGLAMLARAAGLLHDIGKASAAYQAYISSEVSQKGPDHSTAGAREAVTLYGQQLGRLLAFVIAGHHAGLANAVKGRYEDGPSVLLARLDKEHYPLECYEQWKTLALSLPERKQLLPGNSLKEKSDYPGFYQYFLTRMLFSCLVDADFLETERFYAQAEGLPPPARGGELSARHVEAIRAYMASRRTTDTPLNIMRAEILDHAIKKAEEKPGLFTLTVPTGGGKTLTSLSFALEHALRHGLQRVIYVIPYTSIIEQTAQVFREALSLPEDILEHHSNFDWDGPGPNSENDSEQEGRDGLDKLRRDAENWDAPIIVTTTVQFFESLFSARTSRSRKLHNIANSVIVLDEVQTLPLPLLRPCMAVLEELANQYKTSVVLCTATQSALRKCDDALPPQREGAPRQGFAIDGQRELAPHPEHLYTQLKRVQVEWNQTPVTDEEIGRRFEQCEQMLCIVNTRAHAQELYAHIGQMPGARHLTTLMCPMHRRKILAEVREDLKAGRPVRLVSTSLIEAGVDVDFPEVWRAAAGLSSIAQAAGRCNREGRMKGLGRTVVFEALDPAFQTLSGPAEPPVLPKLRMLRSMIPFWEATRAVLRRGLDPLSLEAVHAYFQELYYNKGYQALDAATLPNGRGRSTPFSILPDIAETVGSFTFSFATISAAFRMIDTALEPIIIQWDETARTLISELEYADYPPAGALRKLQHYTVPVPQKVRMQFVADGLCRVLRQEQYGDRFVVLEADNNSLYSMETGLELKDPSYRTEESNIW